MADLIQDRKIAIPAILSGFTVVVICCIIALIAFVKPTDHSSEIVATESSVESLKETESSYGSSTDSQPQHSTGAQDSESQWVYSTISSVEAVCANVHEAMSDECFKALDQFFSNSQVPEYANWTIGIHLKQELIGLQAHPSIEFVTFDFDSYSRVSLPLEDVPSFEFVFGAPQANKEQVQSVLKNEECRVLEGAIRGELHDTCNADSLVGYAMFLDVCHWYEYRQRGARSTYELDRSIVEDMQWDSFEEYHGVRESVLRESFRDAWVVKKCSGFDDDLFSTEGILDLTREGDWRSRRNNEGNAPRSAIGDQRANPSNRQTYRDLIAIATRLGHSWALARYVLPRPEEDRDFWESLRVESPFVFHFYMYKSTALEIDKKERIKHALLAHAHAKLMELPKMSNTLRSFDPKLLKTHLNELEPYTQQQLQEAYSELSADLLR